MFRSSNTLYSLCTTTFSVLVIVCNLVTVKLFRAPFSAEISLPCGLIFFPLIFMMSDLVTEIFGRKKAEQMVLKGFAMSLLAYLMIEIALILPTADPAMQEAFKKVFSLNRYVLIGSLLAYLVAQMLDIQLFTLFRRFTNGKHLWLRTNGSTLSSQLIDTVIVNISLFYFGLNLELKAVIAIIITAYTYKAAFSVLTTPLFYALVKLLKKLLPKETYA